MTTKTEALTMALHDIEWYQIKRQDFDSFEITLISIKEALAQLAEQEPVAWFNRPEVLAINETEDWNDDSQRIVDKAKQDEIAELRLLIAAAQPAAQPAEQEPVEVPEGWKSVPIQPTLAMINALADTDPEHESVWEAVLAAAPQREWTSEDMAYRPGGLTQPEQETDWEGIAADQALTIALLKSEQEPVATKTEKGITLHVGWDDLPADTKLYTSPPKREWVGLTDDEIKQALGISKYALSAIVDARAVEVRLKEKNT